MRQNVEMHGSVKRILDDIIKLDYSCLCLHSHCIIPNTCDPLPPNPVNDIGEGFLPADCLELDF